MSLAARCPWCETVFRLTEGQVSAKGGMARCGICNHTFNALDALLSDSAVAALERSALARKAASEEQSFKKTDPLGPPLNSILAGQPSAPLKTDPPNSASPSPASSTETSPAATTEKTDLATASPAPSVVLAAPPNSPLSSFRLPAFLRQTTPPPAAVQPPPSETRRAAASITDTPIGVAAPSAMPPAATPTPSVAAAPDSPAPAIPAPVVAAPVVAAPVVVPPMVAPVVRVPVVSEPVAPLPVLPTHRVSPARTAVDMEAVKETTPPVVMQPDVAVANYDVALPNYDAASIETEAADSTDASAGTETGISAQIDELQAALAVPQEPLPAPEPTLRELRLSASDTRTQSELAREQERLGPSTFQPSFLKSDESSAGWRRVRSLFTFLLCLVAALGVALQAAYWWRVELAAKVPELKPYLELACTKLHCEIMPPAQIEQLSIESSELVAVPGAPNTLAFTALLRNHSGSAIAYPAIEVTLTDARDRAVLRRDFLPSNYLGDSNRQRELAGVAPSSEYVIKLTFDTSGVATAGYRAGIFYP